MVADPSAISWGAIANRSAIGRRLVGDCILNVCLWLQKVCNFLEIGRQSIGDWSAISRRLNTVSGLSATAATGRRSVANQSATCRQPVGDHQKPFYDRFGRREVSLAATKTSLRSNRPCNRLQPVGDWSPTSLQPPCNLPATTRNFGRKEVADRLQAMCDRGLIPRNTAGLRAAAPNEWQSVTQARIRRFSDQRCTPIRAIVQAPDWHVNY